LRLDLADSAGESVAFLTIDGLKLPRCNLIKIDVEGTGYQVLPGSAETVARNRPKVYMEAKAGVAIRKAIHWLLERSYRCYWHFAASYSPTNFRGVGENVFGPVDDVNLLALPEETEIQVRLPLIQRPDADWTADHETFIGAQ
jgi:Methyltransferase FkbM domain